MVRIGALILAAGRSSRMGSFKPLLPLGDSTFIEEAITRFRRAGIADVRVVIGHRAEELKPVLERIGARWVFNPDHERGMFSSVLAGVRDFMGSAEAFFLLPVDIPLVSPRTIQTLLEACEAHDEAIVYPRFEGCRGHPPVIPTSILEEDFQADVPGGLRAVLARHEAAAVDVDVVDEAVLLDCDTPADYRLLQRRWAAEGIPSEKE
jgi:CTP:molybdopterin cytidylyltransferase MocA